MYICITMCSEDIEPVFTDKLVDSLQPTSAYHSVYIIMKLQTCPGKHVMNVVCVKT